MQGGDLVVTVVVTVTVKDFRSGAYMIAYVKAAVLIKSKWNY